MNTKKVVWIVVAILAVGAVVWLWPHAPASPNQSTTTTGADVATSSDQTGIPAGQSLVAQASYSCDGGKTISAQFYVGSSTQVAAGQPPVPNGSVALTLSDGRTMTLSQTLSADGARYANSDESIIFWSVGNTAFVTESSTKTYSNCTAAQAQ